MDKIEEARQAEMQRCIEDDHNIECEVCGKRWDTISPCALCNATRAISTGRF